MATRWRGQVDPHTRTLVECLPPGTPDRLLLMLRRIAATPTPEQRPDVHRGGATTHTPADEQAAPAGRS
jgi:hypothetical protein